MAAQVGQISKPCYITFGRKTRKWHKRQLAKKERREAKHNPEDAPKKRMTRGWVD